MLVDSYGSENGGGSGLYDGRRICMRQIMSANQQIIIIGRGGHRIQGIRATSKADIKIDQKERHLLVTGHIREVRLAMALIIQAQKESFAPLPSPGLELRLLIPKEEAGQVIGNHHHNLEEIRRTCKVKITTSSPPLEMPWTVFRIEGLAEGLIAAVGCIAPLHPLMSSSPPPPPPPPLQQQQQQQRPGSSTRQALPEQSQQFLRQRQQQQQQQHHHHQMQHQQEQYAQHRHPSQPHYQPQYARSQQEATSTPGPAQPPPHAPSAGAPASAASDPAARSTPSNSLAPPPSGRTTAATLMREGFREFTVIKEVGDGSFGTVCLADWQSPLPSGTMLSPMQHPTTRPEYIGKRLVAIKRMKKPFQNWEECMHLKELKSLLAIPHHPNIIPLYDAFLMPTSKELNFVFECMEGNLYQLTKSRRGRQLAGGLVASIFEQMLQGLHHIHQHGYFHRDIKPESLLITTTGLADYPPSTPFALPSLPSQNGASPNQPPPERDVLVIVKLADFGLARETASVPSYTEYVSTTWYRAPEVLLRSRDYSNPVDMWALGTILAELVNLRPLFPGQGEVDQVLQIGELLGDPSPDYGTDERGRVRGGGAWDQGIRLARAVGFTFRETMPIKFSTLFGPRVPSSLVDCIQDLLRYDPAARPTTQQCIDHVYFKSDAPRLKPSRPHPVIPSVGTQSADTPKTPSLASSSQQQASASSSFSASAHTPATATNAQQKQQQQAQSAAQGPRVNVLGSQLDPLLAELYSVPPTFANLLQAELVKMGMSTRPPKQTLETAEGFSPDRRSEHQRDRDLFVEKCQQLPEPTLPKADIQTIGTFVVQALTSRQPRYFCKDDQFMLTASSIPGGIVYAPALHEQMHGSGWPLWLILLTHYLSTGLCKLILRIAAQGDRFLDGNDIQAQIIASMSTSNRAGVYALQPAAGSIYFGQSGEMSSRHSSYKRNQMPSEKMKAAARVVPVERWRQGVLLFMDQTTKLERCFLETVLILCTKSKDGADLNTRFIDRLPTEEETERKREKRERESANNQQEEASNPAKRPKTDEMVVDGAGPEARTEEDEVLGLEGDEGEGSELSELSEAESSADTAAGGPDVEGGGSLDLSEAEDPAAGGSDVDEGESSDLSELSEAEDPAAGGSDVDEGESSDLSELSEVEDPAAGGPYMEGGGGSSWPKIWPSRVSAILARDAEAQQRIATNTFTANDLPVLNETNPEVYAAYQPLTSSAQVSLYYHSPVKQTHLVKLSGWFLQFWVMENWELSGDTATDLRSRYKDAAGQAGVRVEVPRGVGACLLACFGRDVSVCTGSGKRYRIQRRQHPVTLSVRGARAARWLDIAATPT